MPEILLPAMKSDANVAQITTPGVWEQRDAAALGMIADALNIPEADGYIDHIALSPDVWAQVDRFHVALERNDTATVDEWRGLLATFALAYEEGYPLKITTADLAKIAKRRPGGLAWILTKAPPRTTLGNDPKGTLWNDLGFVECSGVPIGMITPTTLVCPLRSAPDPLPPALHWNNGHRLDDPCRYGTITPIQTELLKRFVDGLLAAFEDDDATVGNLEILSTLRRQLRAFSADLHRQSDRAPKPDTDNSTFRSATLGLRYPNQPLVQRLDHVFEWVPDQRFDSDLKLTPRDEFRTALSGAIIFDPQMAEGWAGANAAGLRLWRQHTLGRVLRQPAQIDRLRQDMLHEGYLLLSPDDLFTPNLWRIQAQEGEARIPAHPSILSRFLLPLKPVALLFLSPAIIAERLRMREDEATGQIHVSLSLPLRNAAGEVQPYSIERTYDADDVTDRCIAGEPAGLAIWPNFRSPNWHRYFAYYSGDPKRHLTISAIFSAASLRADLDKRNGADRAPILAKFDDLMVATTDRLRLRSGDYLREVLEVESWPEAFSCNAPMLTDAGEIESVPAGLLLATPEEEAPVREASSCTLSIDIGTTNTTIYARQPPSGPQQVTFKRRLVFPIPIAPVAVNRLDLLGTSLCGEFIPNFAVSVPFLTVLMEQQSDAVQTLGTGIATRPLWGRSLYAPPSLKVAMDTLVERRQSRLIFNIKWNRGETSDSAAERRLLGVFARQIIMQAAAELAADGANPDNIKVVYSYPEAFDRRQVRDMHRNFPVWAGDALSPQRTRKIWDDDKCQPLTESLATAYYFVDKHRAPTQTSMVTIDIGGHTSDITVWSGGSVRWHSSLHLGGQNILIAFFRHDIDALKRLLADSGPLSEACETLSHLAATDVEDFVGGLEIIVNSPEYAEALKRDSAEIAPEELLRLRSVALLALAGMLYYVGRQIGALKDMSARRQDPISVYLGGRASQLYDNLFNVKTDLVGVSTLFGDTIGERFQPGPLHFSAKPKHEVAHGLLVARSNLSAGNTAPSGSIIGERLLDEPNAEEIDEFLTYGQVNLTRTLRVDPDLPVLTEFLSLVRQRLRLTVRIESDIHKQLAARVDGIFSDLLVNEIREREDAGLTSPPDGDADAEAEIMVMEPVFIIALRELIDMILADRSVMIEWQG